VDQLISDLSLHDDLKAKDAEVTNVVDGTDFVTSIDASAGGFGHEAEHAWVYVKFTPDGAERVNIDDESALESMEWHLSARRFILRLNGGSSGPSCVGAAAFPKKQYDKITEAADTTYDLDAYYSDDCELINDSSGLEGSPKVALSKWWEYPNCVATTSVPFQIQLNDGHILKLVVEQYYGTDQQDCNDSGVAGGDSGHYQIRWSYLQ